MKMSWTEKELSIKVGSSCSVLCLAVYHEARYVPGGDIIKVRRVNEPR